MMTIPSSPGTINDRKILHFQELAGTWWDENANAASAMRAMNTFRLEFIKNAVSRDPESEKTSPLHGLKVLDVGCGGGILTESLAKEGASVVGIDPTEEMIKVAKTHLPPAYQDQVDYIQTTVETMSSDHFGSYDVVVASEVNGSLIISTTNRTWLSRVIIILFIQDLFGTIPKNTFHYSDLMKLEEVTNVLSLNGVSVHRIKGSRYSYLDKKFHYSPTNKLSYILQGIKTDML